MTNFQLATLLEAQLNALHDRLMDRLGYTVCGDEVLQLVQAQERLVALWRVAPEETGFLRKCCENPE